MSEAMSIIYTMPVVTDQIIYIKLLEIIVSIFGFLGIILVFKPPFIISLLGFSSFYEEENLTDDQISLQFIGRCVALVSVFTSAMVYLILRSFSQGEKVSILGPLQFFGATQVFMGGFLMVQYGYTIPTTKDIFIIIIQGFVAFLQQITLQQGLKVIKAGKSAVSNYTIILYSCLYDVFIFNSSIDPLSILGITSILISAGFLFYKNWFQEIGEDGGVKPYSQKFSNKTRQSIFSLQ
ncbi:hypothetical protein PPERSA_10778 [Pseudocohnilembus persalinus]|uniref:Sugar phosphate transporter domain-containing protein n=1 Tax=Pseudocohnilembus persalinus TaxID=266149 RepID=A0A0V0QDK1_PSEPJ|nr:hypothetical protein PPERSA_10778 [Pseudocohnilembus persalinus]|eukprot:KRX00279.1 hypothetical protein PPERSA_10778 [Pseudocohnilembus persalinus]